MQWTHFKCCTFKHTSFSTAIPWQILIRRGGSEVTTELGSLDLLELDANEAGSMFRVELPEPTRVVPIQLGGRGSEFTVRRPPGVAARVHLKGWGSSVVFVDQGYTGPAPEQQAKEAGNELIVVK